MPHPREHSVRTPEKSAIIEARTGRTRSYGALEQRANAIAHLLRAYGLLAGECMAILMEDRIEYFDLVWAAQRSGLYFLPVYTSLGEAETAAMVAHADARLIFASSAYLGKAEAIARLCPQVLAAVCIDDDGSANHLERRLQAMPTTPIGDEAGGQPMQYSGGTTGTPKGIRRPAVTGGIDTPDKLLDLAIDRFGFSPSMRLSTTAPLHHVAPMRFSMMTHRLGGTTILLGDFEAEAALGALEHFAISHSHWIPDMLVRLVKLPEAVKARTDLSLHRCAIHAAAPCPPVIKSALLDWWGPIVHEIYAGTEAPGFCIIGPQEWRQKPGSVGRAAIGSVRIVGPDGAEVPAGQIGQVYFADPLPFSYHKDAQRTRDAFNDKGWATIDDLGWVDADGYVFLIERKGFAYALGGLAIYPRLAEDCIIGHPAVADVGLAALPDMANAQDRVAVVLLLEGFEASASLAATLLNMTQGLPDHQQPTRLIFVDTFPRDDDGKIDRKALARQARKQH